MDRTLFETPTGAPVPAVTAEEMRAVDRVAVDELGLSLLQMMEHAGRGLAGRVREHADADDEVAVLAGSGGNGGGGLACARHLLNRGHTVTVVLDRESTELDGATARHAGILEEMGVTLSAGPDAVPDPADIVVDALVGYGLSGPLDGTAADIVTAVADTATVVSLDVPTGTDATTGDTPGEHFVPEETVTLALPKTGLVDVPGRLTLADIGIPAVVYERVGVEYNNPFAGFTVELVR